MRGEPIRPQPKPVRKEKAKRWGTRRAKKPEPATALLAFPKPVSPTKTKHGRRERELGRMLFYSQLWCMLRDLEQTGNIEPHLSEWASTCGRGPFWRKIEVAHLGDRGATGTGGYRRAPDAKTAPLCRKHHRAIDGSVGGRAREYVALGREGQQELRAKLVLHAGYYWDALTPEGREVWNQRAAAERRAA